MTGRTGSLAWAETGDSSARALVLIHALGADMRMWEPHLAALARMRRVITVDLPGHGTSVASEGPFTVSRLGEDILDIADAAEASTFDLCGVSLGGLISLWISAHAPDRVSALVASNTAARIGSEEIWQARIDAIAEGGIAAVSEAALGRFFTPGFVDVDRATYENSAKTLLGTDPEAYVACCAALRDADLRELVEAIHCPTLVIGGGADISTPPDQAEWLYEHIVGSRLAIIDEAPHFANLERPDEWGRLVIEFLKELG
jgi:3-oxoadipate enol-lactonase